MGLQSLIITYRKINLKTYIFHGGISSEEQVQAARLGIDILIATPGRLIDLMNQKFIKLDETYIKLSLGVKNILSISGANDRFIVAN